MTVDLHSTKTPFARILRAKQRVLRQLKADTGIVLDAGDFTIPVTARIGSTVFQVDTGEQFNTRIRSVDFLIAIEDLTHPDTLALFEPQTGFVLSRTINGTVHKYQCLPPAQKEPSWRYSDTSLSEYRIHTKLIEETPV